MDAYGKEFGSRSSRAAPSPASTATVLARRLQGPAHIPQTPSSRTSRDTTTLLSRSLWEKGGETAQS